MNNFLTPVQATAVYNILVEYAGADPKNRHDFIYHAVKHGIDEYRFIGWLGFGGKYRAGNYVDCYPEDMNDARREIIDQTNEALKALDL